MLQNAIALAKDVPRPPETVLVNVTPQETRVAILENSTICELHIERNSGRGLVAIFIWGWSNGSYLVCKAHSSTLVWTEPLFYT